MRKFDFKCDYTVHADGSVLVSFGDTKVICTVMVEDGVPKFLKDENQGWLTAEYSMLPSSTPNRKRRRKIGGEMDGRSVEIARLISRSLRASIDLEAIGERTFYVDCDVIQADGGTRTASISGAYLALMLAVEKLISFGEINSSPLVSKVASVSVGKVDGKIVTDLNYSQDSKAEVDLNIVMDNKGQLIEVQGTAENGTFSREELNQMIDSAEEAISEIFEKMEASFAQHCRSY